jgi:hypothetical protein
MEGVFAFFAESSFLGVFLFGEKRVGRGLHWLSSVMVALGAVVSGYFIVATNAWMQHPVSYRIVEGRAELTSLWGLLTNPYVRWQYPHVISGSMVVASMVVAGIGAFYLLSRRHEAAARTFVRVGVTAGTMFSQCRGAAKQPQAGPLGVSVRHGPGSHLPGEHLSGVARKGAGGVSLNRCSLLAVRCSLFAVRGCCHRPSSYAARDFRSRTYNFVPTSVGTVQDRFVITDDFASTCMPVRDGTARPMLPSSSMMISLLSA